nr:hypothetical protein Iba_chr12bCG21810 [Ipomoea batatas]
MEEGVDEFSEKSVMRKESKEAREWKQHSVGSCIRKNLAELLYAKRGEKWSKGIPYLEDASRKILRKKHIAESMEKDLLMGWMENWESFSLTSMHSSPMIEALWSFLGFGFLDECSKLRRESLLCAAVCGGDAAVVPSSPVSSITTKSSSLASALPGNGRGSWGEELGAMIRSSGGVLDFPAMVVLQSGQVALF